MSDQHTLVEAINTMKIIEFRYKNTWRSVEPHALGHNARGKLTLCAWQLSGGSGEDWRDYHIELMTDLVITDLAFDTARPGFNPCDKTLTNLICSVSG